MVKNKGGRPKTNSDDELLLILEDYLNKHEGEKIILSKLSKDTGIPRHRWDYSTKAKEIISKINNPVILLKGVSDELKALPSVESLIEQNSSNPKKLKDALAACIKIINNLIDKTRKTYEMERMTTLFEKQILDLKEEKKLLKEQLKKQENAMLELCIESESLKKRKEKNLKSNIITIDNQNLKKASAVTEEDIKSQFPWLAD